MANIVIILHEVRMSPIKALILIIRIIIINIIIISYRGARAVTCFFFDFRNLRIN